jgi:hypothetical protein
MSLGGLELALLSGLGGSLIKGISGAYGAGGAAADLKLSEEQKRRLKELERMEAEDAFGMSAADRDVYSTRVMSPVQTAEREALARFGASQAVGDIGQGAAFRQQQALKQTGEAARAEAQRAVAEKEASVAQAQQQQLEQLRQQELQRKAMERQAVMSMLGAVGEGVAQAGGVAAKMKFAEEQYALNKPSAEDTQVVGSTANILFPKDTLAGVNMSGSQGLGMNGVDSVYAMIDQSKSFNPLIEALPSKSFNPLTKALEQKSYDDLFALIMGDY